MAKKILTVIKLQIKGGQANPAPPVGPALGQHGLNIAEFCAKFNDATKEQMGDVVPVEITVYADRTYTFITKTPPASELIKKFAKIPKGSGKPLSEKVGSITQAQLKKLLKLNYLILMLVISQPPVKLLWEPLVRWVLKLKIKFIN